jgi:iron complex outermembrane receptor protein
MIGGIMHSAIESVSSAVARTLHRRDRFVLPWMAATLAMASPAFAAAPATDELDEVIVTATFRQENLQNTAIAITAVSGERLEDQGLTNVTDLGLVIPNASIRQQTSFSGPTPAIGMRGVQTTDFIYTSDPGVGIYIDDVYHGSLTGSAIDLLDLERIEVLRGPQGTLFGKNSLGGAIRLISKEPKGNDTGAVEVTYGTSNRLNLKGNYDFAMTDNLFVRISGVSKQIDGYQDVLDWACQMRVNGTPALAGTFPLQVPTERYAKGDCKIAERGGQDNHAGRVMFRYLASDALEIGLSADYSKTSDESPPDSYLVPHLPTDFFNNAYSNTVIVPRYGTSFTVDNRFLTGDPFKTYASPIDPVQGKTYPPGQFTTAWGSTGKLQYKFTDNLVLNMVVGYRTYDSSWMGDGDNLPIDLNHTYELQGHEQWSYEGRLAGNLFDGRIEWTTGLYYYDSKSHLGGRVTLPAFNSILPDFNENDNFTTKSKSGFVHGTFKATDALSLTAGVRYTDETKTYAFDHSPYLFIPGKAVYGSAHTDWKVSADYRINDEAMVYGSVATGFRSDGAQPRPFTLGQQKVPVAAEELMAYEIGTKLDLLDRRLRVNVAVFMDDYDPRIFTSNGTQCAAGSNPDPGQPYRLPPAPANLCPAGTALAGTPGIPWIIYDSAPGEDRGAELELTATPISNLSINATLAWFDFKSKADKLLSNGQANPGYVDPSFDVQAKVSGSLGAQYRISVGEGSLTPRIDWFYQGSRNNGSQYLPQLPGNANTIGGYGLVNARLSYASGDGKWDLTVSAENLLDKFYWYQLGPSRSTINGALVGPRVGSPARGRELAVTFKRNFE